MGTGAGTGLNFGHTKGNQFIELETAGVKFTKEDVLFVTKDKTGQLVWLEKGNQRAGLEHILNGSGNTGGHAADFERAFGLMALLYLRIQFLIKRRCYHVHGKN